MKTKRTPLHSAKPNHVGPVGEKMWSDAAGRTHWVKATHEHHPVLLISLDPANVERIRQEIAWCLHKYDFLGADYEGQATAVLNIFGLTPAKRKGRKAQ